MNEKSSSEQRFLIGFTLRPEEPGYRLRPAETQLLLAYAGEILQEIEIEEKRIIEEERKAAREITGRKTSEGDETCK